MWTRESFLVTFFRLSAELAQRLQEEEERQAAMAVELLPEQVESPPPAPQQKKKTVTETNDYHGEQIITIFLRYSS